MDDKDYMWALKTGDLDEVKAKVQTVKKTKNKKKLRFLSSFPFSLTVFPAAWPRS